MTAKPVSDYICRQRIAITVTVTVSLLAHISLILLPVSRPSVEMSRNDDLVILLTRTKTPLPEAAVESESGPGVVSIRPSPEHDVAESRPHRPTVTTALTGQLPDADGNALRAQALALARDLPVPAASAPHDSTSRQSPRLPFAPGWINGYVGQVRASRAVWREASGEIAARLVSADGRVTCGRMEAPEPWEIFNPSLSARVMRFYSCGRERPLSAAHEDPWMRSLPGHAE